MTDGEQELTAEQQQIAELNRQMVKLQEQVSALQKCQLPKVDDRVKQVHDYAWAWFSYHAQQRTSVFNFFLAASALLFAGFGAAVNAGNPSVAVGTAAIGAIASFSFLLVDGRNQALVGLGKSVLEHTEGCLFEAVKADNKHDFGSGIVLADNDLGNGRQKARSAFCQGKHRVHFRLIELVVLGAFLYAACLAICCPDCVMPKKPDETAKVAGAIKPIADSVKELSGAMTRAAATLAGVSRQAPPTALPTSTSPMQTPSGGGEASDLKQQKPNGNQ